VVCNYSVAEAQNSEVGIRLAPLLKSRNYGNRMKHMDIVNASNWAYSKDRNQSNCSMRKIVLAS
jgi:hypothetical protein